MPLCSIVSELRYPQHRPRHRGRPRSKLRRRTTIARSGSSSVSLAESGASSVGSGGGSHQPDARRQQYDRDRDQDNRGDDSTWMSSKRAVVSLDEEGDEQGAHEGVRNACEAANGHLAEYRPRSPHENVCCPVVLRTPLLLFDQPSAIETLPHQTLRDRVRRHRGVCRRQATESRLPPHRLRLVHCLLRRPACPTIADNRRTNTSSMGVARSDRVLRRGRISARAKLSARPACGRSDRQPGRRCRMATTRPIADLTRG